MSVCSVRWRGEIAGPIAEESVGAECHCCLAWGIGWAESASGDEAAYAYESPGIFVSFVIMHSSVNMLTHMLVDNGLFCHRQ